MLESSIQLDRANTIVDCLRVTILASNDSKFQSIFDKTINVDLKSIMLEKQLTKVKLIYLLINLLFFILVPFFS